MSTSTSTKRKPKTETPATETADGEAAGAATLTASSETGVQELCEALRKCGFCLFTAESLDDITDDELAELETDTLVAWGNEGNEGRAGRGEALRTPVPEFLRRYEGVDAETASEVTRLATQAVAAGHVAQDNPFPPGSLIAGIWLESWRLAISKAEAVTPVNPPAIQAAREKTDRAAEQRQLIEDLQAQIEANLGAERDAIQRYNHHKAKAKSAKQDCDDVAVENRELYEKLQDAREGRMPAQRALPFKETFDVPDQGVATSPPAPLVDTGAFISLDMLVKGDLQEFIPGTPEDMGISNKQCESLKGVVGENIADLEKWQRENGGGSWWRKALKEKGIGLGGAAGDKLADAYDTIRRKFPMPQAGDEPAAPAEPTGPVADAVKRIKALILRAGELAASCDDTGGAKFCQSVATEAGKILLTIEKTQAVTGPQTAAMDSWDDAVEKWAPRDDFGGDVLEDDLP
jgi:hypothetical protein